MNTVYFTELTCPIGKVTLTATERGLCGLYNENQKHWPKDSAHWHRDNGSLFNTTRIWLDTYFETKLQKKLPQIHFISGTDFQRRVWTALKSISIGETASYGIVAQKVESPNAVRAVGAAVGRNPISIIIPCHRVIGSNGSLTSYAGGLDKKKWLLKHEDIKLQ